jgi:HAE1 family hydrophobic/amphiphilic exporter-1
MYLFATASLKNRALIALVTIVVALFGVISIGGLRQELIPSVQFPTIAVITSYPGASPEVVNEDVSGPIEAALRGVPNLERTTATSSTNSSVVLAEFTYGIDLASTEQKVERAINRISSLLPKDADPQVLSGSIDDLPVIQIAVTPGENSSEEEAGALVTRIALPELGDIDGVREAQLVGARGDRISITPNTDKLAENGLSVTAISDALQQNGILVPAGTVADGDRTLAVQAGSTINSVEQVAALPLVWAPDGYLQPVAPVTPDPAAVAGLSPAAAAAARTQPPTAPSLAPAPRAALTIGEVADVRIEQNPITGISRVDGKPALTIAVTKVSNANTVEVSRAVTELLPELEQSLGGATLSVVFDQAPFIEESIQTLAVEGLLGLLFAILVILVFLLSIRATLVTAISIPTSVLVTFIALNFAGYTLNILTLGALTIAIGRVVDDSIVVIENIKRHLVPGADKAAIIVKAVREVSGAVTASTLTSVAVFLPLALVAGLVGELFRPFALTVTIALVASLLVSLTIVPVLAYWFLKPDRVHVKAGESAQATEAVGEERVTKLQRSYLPVITWTLRRPVITMLIAALMLGATVAAAPLMKTNFIGNDGQNAINLSQTLAPGTSLDVQLAQAERVEAALADVPEIDSVQVTIGGSGGFGAFTGGGGGDGVVSYAITTNPDVDQVELQKQIRAAVDAIDDAGELSLAAGGGGGGFSSSIAVEVTAPDQELLAEASDEIVAALKEQPNLIEVESNLGTSRPYLSIDVNVALAAEVGLSEATVSSLVAQRMQPSRIGQIVLNNSNVGVFLTDAVVPADRDAVAAIEIPSVVGPKRLDAIATVEVADGPVSITTVAGTRSATVSALPLGDDLTAANADVDTALEGVQLPAGAKAAIGGVTADQAESFGQLGLALLAAILIVYIIMVATFKSLLQPLLLLVSVPFAATGAIALQIISGTPLGVASLIGVLMLIGIVVTNAIVLVDLVNQLRTRGQPLREAVMFGSARRLRPILMTALATILALVPMALGITGQGGFISQPLAIVVIGGLLSSTVLTLIVLPTLYFLVEGARERGAESRSIRREERLDARDERRAARAETEAPKHAPVEGELASAPYLPEQAEVDAWPGEQDHSRHARGPADEPPAGPAQDIEDDAR